MIDEAQARVRRDRPLTISVGLQVDPAADVPRMLAAYEQAGAEHVILNFGPRPFETFDREALKKPF